MIEQTEVNHVLVYLLLALYDLFISRSKGHTSCFQFLSIWLGNQLSKQIIRCSMSRTRSEAILSSQKRITHLPQFEGEWEGFCERHTFERYVKVFQAEKGQSGGSCRQRNTIFKDTETNNLETSWLEHAIRSVGNEAGEIVRACKLL